MPTVADLVASKQSRTSCSKSPTIDFYRNAWAKEPTATTTLADLIDAILSDEYAAPVAKVRAALAADDLKAAEVAKKNLPAVSLSGVVDGQRMKAASEGRFTHSGLVQIDLDKKDNPKWSVDDMRAVLIGDAHMVAVFVTPSGQGVKGVARIHPDAETHLASFLAAEAHFAEIGLKIDRACKDPVRLCFVSHDPDAWIRDLEEAEVFEPIEQEEGQEHPAPHPQDTEHATVARSTERAYRIGSHGGIVINSGRDRETMELTLEDLSAMIAGIPRPSYDEWLHICSGAWNHFGIAATPVLAARWPEEKDGEYDRKFTQRTKDHTIGTVWHFAEAAGWKPDKRMREIRKDVVLADRIEKITKPLPVDDDAHTTMQSFRPDDIFYDAPAGKYLVKIGRSYFVHGRKGPVITGLVRHYAKKIDKPTEVQAAAVAAIQARELDGGVQWTGTIAGHKQGLATDANGLPILITSEANPPEPKAGEANLISELITSAFTDTTATTVFMSWLASRYKCVRDHVHVPSPMLVLAGEVNSGKSLLAWIVAQVLGGRTANPYSSWAGGMLWNDDLVGSELLLVDDCSSSTDIRARRAFGASFKEAIYPHVVQLRKRNSSSVSVRPVWCVIVCCNDTPESLQIIPPLDADLSDKVAMLHVTGITPPVDTSTPEGRKQLQSLIRAELPAFAAELMAWETPEDLRDSRSGVKAWRDPELAEAVEAHSPAKRLEAILESAVSHMGIWHDLPCTLTAAEIESRLLDQQSPVREQARGLFTWHGACGSALARLARMGSEYIELAKPHPTKRIACYTVKPPEYRN
jgi:hypothetical protein